jgi:sec-independent protein translocase protein TatA
VSVALPPALTAKETDMPSIGPMELTIVLIIALVILGPKRFPETGRSLGRGMREFKESIRGEDKAHEELPASVEAPARPN